MQLGDGRRWKGAAAARFDRPAGDLVYVLGTLPTLHQLLRRIVSFNFTRKSDFVWSQPNRLSKLCRLYDSRIGSWEVSWPGRCGVGDVPCVILEAMNDSGSNMFTNIICIWFQLHLFYDRWSALFPVSFDQALGGRGIYSIWQVGDICAYVCV